jgi:hypothetical protein
MCEDGDDCTANGVCSSGSCVSGQPIDSDEDQLPDCIDNCPDTFNPDQADGNSNGTGDACEAVTITLDWVGPGDIAVTEIPSGALIPVTRGVPFVSSYGNRITLKAMTVDECGLFIGWSGDFESEQSEIELYLDKNVSVQAVFLERSSVPSACGAGSCQTLAVSLLMMGAMRLRSRQGF